MNLDNSHGTRCESKEGAKGTWTELVEDMLEEVRQLEMGRRILKIEDDKKIEWIWENSSLTLKKFIARKERSSLDLMSIKEELEISYKEEQERILEEGKVRECEALQLKVNELETRIKEEAQKKEIERIDRMERELQQLRRIRNNEGKICHSCGGKGHIARFCTIKKWNKEDSKYRFEQLNLSNNISKTKKYERNMDEESKSIQNKWKIEIGRKREEIDRVKRRKIELDDVIADYTNVFTNGKEEIKYCTLEKCKIETEEGEMVIKRTNRIPQAIMKQMTEYLGELERRKIIRKSVSMWRNPIRAVPKPDGSIRLVSNLMALNDLTKKDEYMIPNIRDIIRATQGSTIFTVLDLKDAFYHIEIEEQDKHKTAFEFEGNVYEWNSLVMGFKNAPQLMQRVMNRILGDLKGDGVEVYIDDIVIHAKDSYKHDRLINEVLERLEKNNLTVNKKKVQWRKNEIYLLGVTINGKEQEASEIKRNEALEYPIPNNISELRRFLGMTGWFASFIKNYADKTKALTDGLKGKGKNWKWSAEMDREFIEIKNELRNLKRLLLANYDKPFMLRTDASNTGLGAVLLQEDETGKWRPIQWASKKLTPAEKKYGITEKEMYAVFWAIKKFEYELRGRKFKLVTDHKALTEIRKKAEFNNSRVTRWNDLIQEFDFEVEYRKGEELVAPDALSRLYEGDDEETVKESSKKKGKWDRHVEKREGIEYWKFDDGEEREIPKREERLELVKKMHEEINHRGIEAVYYEMKKKWYWPGMKETVNGVIKTCEICQINNRKTMGGEKFIETTRPLEKVALDIMKVEDINILVGIDYFSRMIWTRILENRSADEVGRTLKDWFENTGERPVELIMDNGKEFDNTKIKKIMLGLWNRKKNGKCGST